LIETGPLGAALALWAAGRVARDLVGAHLLGRGRCPVGRDTDARRSDPFSVGIAIGALGAVVALLVHSAVDFPARIPADGILAARAPGEQAPPEAQALATAAVTDLRRLLASTPSNPFVHERLAWALELQSAARGDGGADLHRAALLSMQRAVALQPENPYL